MAIPVCGLESQGALSGVPEVETEDRRVHPLPRDVTRSPPARAQPLIRSGFSTYRLRLDFLLSILQL